MIPAAMNARNCLTKADSIARLASLDATNGRRPVNSFSNHPNNNFMIAPPSIPCPPEDADLFLSEPSKALEAMLERTPGDFMVLGAGGKMGLHLCLMLRRALDAIDPQRRVVAVSRFSQADTQAVFEKHGIEVRACDLSDSEQLDQLETPPNVIFMAGAKFGTSDQPSLLHRMNIEMPAQVAKKFQDSRITAFSTGCVYSFFPTDGTGPDEKGTTEPVGEYAQSCLGREKAFLESATQNGTRVSLIRLNYAVEFRYGLPVDLATKILEGTPISLEMGHANIIWQRDAILHSLLAHEHASAEGFILNVTRPEICRIRDLALKLGDLLGKQPIFEGSEAPDAWISDSSKAIRLFGEPETSVESILGYVAAWLGEGLPTLGKPTGFDRRDGNF